MFQAILREVKTISGSLLTMCLMLILLFFVLNWVKRRNFPFVSNVAGWAENHASPNAYDPVSAASLPMYAPTGMGPML
jgi:hypothetical protein